MGKYPIEGRNTSVDCMSKIVVKIVSFFDFQYVHSNISLEIWMFSQWSQNDVHHGQKWMNVTAIFYRWIDIICSHLSWDLYWWSLMSQWYSLSSFLFWLMLSWLNEDVLFVLLSLMINYKNIQSDAKFQLTNKKLKHRSKSSG